MWKIQVFLNVNLILHNGHTTNCNVEHRITCESNLRQYLSKVNLDAAASLLRFAADYIDYSQNCVLAAANRLQLTVTFIIDYSIDYFFSQSINGLFCKLSLTLQTKMSITVSRIYNDMKQKRGKIL